MTAYRNMCRGHITSNDRISSRYLFSCIQIWSSFQEDIPTKLFVGRLPSGTTTQQLCDHFEEYGPLKDVYVPNNFRGFGFVTFSSRTQANAAMGVTHQLNVSVFWLLSKLCFGCWQRVNVKYFIHINIWWSMNPFSQ